MKLCSFIILAAFKFGDMDPNRQIVKLRSLPKYGTYMLSKQISVGCMNELQLPETTGHGV